MEIDLNIGDQIKEVHKKRTKYGKYEVAIEKYVPWIKEQISKSKEDKIAIKTMDMARILEISKSPTAIYWALKYILFYKDIIVSSGAKNDEQVLIMRFKNENDELPPSLKEIKIKDEKEEKEEKFEIFNVF